LDATISAFSRIQAGLGDCFIVGGAEGMSRAPYVLSKSESSYDGRQQMFDTSLGWRFPNKAMKKQFPLSAMGVTAENVVDKHNISREEQDLFAYNSHQKAIAAQKAGAFDDELLSITVPPKSKYGEALVFDKDECPREDTSLEKLSTLRAVFREGGSVTAGNSSSLNDGAASLLVVSEDFFKAAQSYTTC
jgi:acetyl-CoA acyltransferase